MRIKKIIYFSVIGVLLSLSSCKEEGLENGVDWDSQKETLEQQELSGEEKAIKVFDEFLFKLNSDNALSTKGVQSKAIVINVNKTSASSYSRNVYLLI